MTDPIEELLSRRVAKILPSSEALAKLLKSGKKIRLYQGFDPTGGHLHLGHTVGLRKLMDFARLGHEVIMLFGTGTVLVGDPSLRDTGRKLVTQAEIDRNIAGWKHQVSPLVDFSKVTIKQNGDWLIPLTLKDIIHLGSQISSIQLFKRDSFQRRLDRGDTVWYHETMYPLLQGYDSVAMDVDLEIGGTDQEFNMLIGRELQHKLKGREKFVLTTPMILGTDGKTMSKTSGNCVFLDDPAEDMFGKIMAMTDDQIIPYFTLLTDTPSEYIQQLSQDLSQQRINPLEAKKELATNIVTQFHGQETAKDARTHFETTIQRKQAPTDIQTITVPTTPQALIKLCQLALMGESNSQIKRTIEQGGVEVDGQKITNPNEIPTYHDGTVIKYGKRTFFKLKILTLS